MSERLQKTRLKKQKNFNMFQGTDSKEDLHPPVESQCHNRDANGTAAIPDRVAGSIETDEDSYESVEPCRTCGSIALCIFRATSI